MTSVSKKFLTAFLSLTAALCLAFGLFLTIPRTASADEVNVTEAYMDIDGGVFKGLKSNVSEILTEGAAFTLDIPDSVTEIAAGTGSSGILGSYVTGLSGLTIPASVTSIGNNAFYGCTSLSVIRYYATSASNGSENAPFNGIGEATVYIGDNSQPTVTKIPSYLFRNTNISSVVFTNVNISTAENFGQNAFENCKYLKNVTVIENTCTISAIRDEAFKGCTALSHMDLQRVAGLKTIGSKAFEGCTALKVLHLPDSIENVNDAFVTCESLLELRIPAGFATTDKFPQSILYTYSTGDTHCFNEEDGNNFEFIYYGDAGNYKVLLIGYNGASTELVLPDKAVIPANSNSYGYEIYKNAFSENTTITSVTFPDAPSYGCNEVQEGAFKNCYSLTEVDMQNARFSNISNSMFEGCGALVTATLSSYINTIGAYAFANCASLSTVDISGDNSLLTAINSHAFEDCTGLLEITIPTHRDGTATNFADSAFAGCTSLEKVYLPAKATFSEKAFINRATDSTTLLLIAPDKASYGYYNGLTTKPEGDEGDGKTYIFTYKVDVELYSVPESGSAQLTDSGDEYFFGVVPDHMPIQSGYSVSVWYDSEACTNKVDVTAFGNKLKEAGVDNVKLYAYELAEPENVTIDPNFSVLYNQDGQNILTEWFNGWEDSYNDKYTFAVTGYVNMSHSLEEVGDTAKLTDAGTYTLSLVIKDKEKYGEWTEGSNDFTVKVTPRELEGDELNAFTWGVVNGGRIDKFDTVIGHVVECVDDNPSLIPTVTIDNANGIYSAYNSTLSYNNEPFTVELVGGSQYVRGTVSYVGNVQRDRGMWISSARVVLENNYRLPTSRSTATVTGAFDFGRENITITYNDADNSFTVYKTWFIIVSGGNKLKNGNADYSIENWTYGKNGGPEISAPELQYGNDVAGTLLSYRLVMMENDGTDAIMTFTFSHSDFGKYVNGSMPAGDYILEVSIKDYDNYPGTGEKPVAVRFTVEKGSISELLGGDTGNLGRAFALTELYTNEKTFGDYMTAFPVLSLRPEEIHPITLLRSINGNVWASYEYPYYTGFDIKFRVNSDIGYFTFDDHTGAPREAGSYTIYYNIFTYSYEDRYNSSSNACCYTLTIQDVITIGNVDVRYDGKSWQDRIVAFINNPAFKVYYLDSSKRAEEMRNTVKAQLPELTDFPVESDTYINTGVHWVVLESTGLAKWNEDEVTPVPGTSWVLYKFNITKGVNSTTQNVSVSGWEWRAYEKAKNIVYWATQYGVNDGVTYDYVLVSKKDGSKYYYTPAGDQKGFNDADAGEYWLKPIAWGSDNVFDFNTAVDGDETYSGEWATVQILPATVTWRIAPRIESWKYGDDVANVINGNVSPVTNGELDSKFSDVSLPINPYYCRLEDYGTPGIIKYPTLEAYLSSIGETYVPAGNYVYVYEISAGNNNVNGWSYPVYFTVLKADNYWDDAPVINGWNYGDTNALNLTYAPHFGNVRDVEIDYWYVNKNGIEELIVGSINGATLGAGTYKYRAVLKGSANYDDLIFPDTYFEVYVAQNRWEDVPVIAGWNEGRYNSELNAPSAKPVCGEYVYFTITDLDGNVMKGLERLTADQLNSQKMNSLEVGSYYLIAEVDGTNDYSNLKTPIRFSVMEDSIGMTGLIVATMIFAGIAVGLAVAGVILLIRRNKKIEEEFRKMIRTELRRK